MYALTQPLLSHQQRGGEKATDRLMSVARSPVVSLGEPNSALNGDGRLGTCRSAASAFICSAAAVPVYVCPHPSLPRQQRDSEGVATQLTSSARSPVTPLVEPTQAPYEERCLGTRRSAERAIGLRPAPKPFLYTALLNPRCHANSEVARGGG